MSAMRSLAADPLNAPAQANPCSVTLLRACNKYTKMLSGLHMGKSFHGGGYHPEDYSGAFLFQAETVAFDGIRELADIMASAARDGLAAMAHGEPVATGTAMRRLASPDRNRLTGKMDPATLLDVPRKWSWIDLDGIPNLQRIDPNLPGIDPRVEPERAIAFLRSLLPPSIGGAKLAWDWSSKCAVPFRTVNPKTGELSEWDGQGAPPQLRAHMAAVFDQGLAWQDGKAVQLRLRNYVADRLEERGFKTDPAAAYVDWKKTTEAQALLYVAAPRFLDGAVDPFPGDARRGLTEGHDEVCLADLLAELDAADAARTRVTPSAPGKVIKTSAGPARTRRAERPAPAPQVIPMAAARRRLETIEADAAARADTAHARAQGYNRIYSSVVRYASELPIAIGRLALDRRARGETDPAWRDWHLAGGVPEGLRDSVANIVASAVCLSLQPGIKPTMPRERVRQEILTALAAIIDAAWLEDAWVGKRYDAAVLNRYERAASGETVEFGGRGEDTPVYVYGKERIRAELAVTDEECVRLGLWALATERARSALRREESGCQQVDELRDVQHAADAEVARLSAQGMSQVQVARHLGLSRGKVQRALQRTRAVTADQKVQPDQDVTVMPTATEDVPATSAATVSIPAPDTVRQDAFISALDTAKVIDLADRRERSRELSRAA